MDPIASNQTQVGSLFLHEHAPRSGKILISVSCRPHNQRKGILSSQRHANSRRPDPPDASVQPQSYQQTRRRCISPHRPFLRLDRFTKLLYIQPLGYRHHHAHRVIGYLIINAMRHQDQLLALRLAQPYRDLGSFLLPLGVQFRFHCRVGGRRLPQLVLEPKPIQSGQPALMP